MSQTQILVVEDEIIVAESIRSQLNSLGYEVPDLAISGEQAVQKAEEIRPDLVLMDIKLSGKLDGIGAGEQIWRRFDVPVVYLTGYADEETLQRAKLSEPFGYLLKPFEIRELRSTIEVALYRYRLETELRENETRYRTLSQLISDYAYMFRLEPEGQAILEWTNESLGRLIGVNYEETPEMEGWISLAHPDDQALVRQHWRALRRGEPAVSEYRLIGPQGKVYWLRDYGYPVWDDTEERTVQIMGAAQDITDRKKREEALQESEALYRTVVDAMPDFVYVVDRELRLVLVNRAFRHYLAQLGLDEDPLGEEIFELLTSSADTLRAEYKQVLQSGQSITAEEALQIGPQKLWTETRKLPVFDREKKAYQVMTIVRDITARRRMANNGH